MSIVTRVRTALGFTTLIVLSGTVPAYADSKPDPLFLSDDILDVTITAPITTIMRERPIEEYVPAKFAYTESDGSSVEFNVGLRTRGRFRRRPETCEFAPLRVNFRKEDTKKTLFHKQDKLKLVTHCQNGSPNYQQSVLSEYIAYRILNMLTDVSFRVRLLRVTYVDTEKGGRKNVSFAFLIEHADRLAKRIDTPGVSTRMITIPQLIPDYAALAALFQYFIGNTDYSQIATGPGEDCCHNHELFAREGEQFYSVPYDLDMTGWVNAEHSRPNSRFGLRSARERLYRGRCAHNSYLPDAVVNLERNRDAIYDLINTNEYLDNATRRSQIRFADSYYQSVNSPKKIKRNLYDKCVSPVPTGE